jgi:hypothetical protein
MPGWNAAETAPKLRPERRIFRGAPLAHADALDVGVTTTGVEGAGAKEARQHLALCDFTVQCT